MLEKIITDYTSVGDKFICKAIGIALEEFQLLSKAEERISCTRAG